MHKHSFRNSGHLPIHGFVLRLMALPPPTPYSIPLPKLIIGLRMQCKLNQQLNDEHKGIIIEVKVLATMFTFDYNMGAYLADAYDSGGEKSQQERLAFQRK